MTFQDFQFQGREIEGLQKQINDHKLVHAILITGDPGTGKRTLAMLLAASLMCRSDSGKPCHKCSNCIMAESGDQQSLWMT